jgi:hypothetical protein
MVGAGADSVWNWERSETSSKYWLGNVWFVHHHFQRSQDQRSPLFHPVLMAEMLLRHTRMFCAKVLDARRRRKSCMDSLCYSDFQQIGEKDMSSIML